MFLKLFPRYAGRARRGATVAGDNLRGTAVVVENAPKSLSRHDGASVIRACRQRCEELVAETLVVPFCVIVHYVFGYRCPQVSLTERYEAVETLSTYGENESFRVCVALLHGPEQIADLPVPVAESPGAVRIGHPERSHLVEYLAPNSVFNSLPRQRSSPHLRPDDRLVTIDRVLHHASLGVA